MKGWGVEDSGDMKSMRCTTGLWKTYGLKYVPPHVGPKDNSRPSKWYEKEGLRMDRGQEREKDRGGEGTGEERAVSKGSWRRKTS